MPQDNQLSPLFGHMQDTLGDAIPAPQEVSDKTSTILEGLSPVSATPESAPLESPFGTAVPSTPTTPIPDASASIAEIIPITPASEPLFAPTSALSALDITPNEATLPEIGNDIPTLPEVPTATEISPTRDTLHPENIDSDISPGITTSTAPAEILEEKDASSTETAKKSTDASKLAQYLQADKVYQEMIHEENSEKIRLQLAIRYTLLMFAIFLVFAWIVSNRVIMFGFSEFVWLARIRDFLFAVMSGLFGLTLWFGSVAWTHNTTLISVIRTLAVVFFGAVVIALYIPF